LRWQGVVVATLPQLTSGHTMLRLSQEATAADQARKGRL
jgi:hypothetical protein